MSALWGEMKVTARTPGMPHIGKQSINSAISQDVKPCHVVDWCLLCVRATKIRHFDSLHEYTTRARVQRKTESNWMLWRYAGKGGEERVSKHVASVTWIIDARHLNYWWPGGEQRNCHTVHRAPLSRQNRLRLISDTWIRISKGWKRIRIRTWNLKFANSNFV